MSLLLTGAKTMTFAGTEMSCLEIYTGEAYTLPITFTDANGNPANANGWSVNVAAKFYEVDVSYSADLISPVTDQVNLTNLELLSPQPNTGANTYTANLTVNFSNADAGTAYLYVPADLTGNVNGDGTPVVQLAQSGANSTLVILTIGVTRPNAVSSEDDFNREPLGFVVRYQ